VFLCQKIKLQKTNNKRLAVDLIWNLELVEKTNNKRLAVDLIWNLELVVWNLFEI